jgi:Zn-dependent protease with chaperone function
LNFFDAQDRARRATRWLVVVYVAATALIVAGVTLVVAGAFYTVGEVGTPPHPSLLVGTAALATLLIVGSTLYKTARLSSGGSRVAADLGGTLVSADVQDPLRQRLRNVVEEIAIASGVPVPDIFVLEQEPGINAFAAGYAPGDAAVAVTRGALELLDRDELQGVIAHEFSHILNGDMRLNIRMMGVLFGIMVIGMIGRTILRNTRTSKLFSSRRGNRNAGGIILIGLGFAILGWIGVLFARIVKAAVSRQREYLADASAVQFTRQTDGIAGALKKIGGYEARSYFRAADPEEVSHMLIARGARFTSLFATHPPLTERIRKLEPGFDDSQYPDIRLRDREPASSDDAGMASSLASAGGAIALAPSALSASVGRPGGEHIDFATRLRRAVPATIAEAAHSPSQAYLLTLALLLAGVGKPDRQLDLLRQQLGPERAATLQRFHTVIAGLGPHFRLPLLEISFPALKRMPEQHVEFLLDLARRLVDMDGIVDFEEYCFLRILATSLGQSAAPGRSGPRGRPGRDEIRHAAITLLQQLALRGHAADEMRREAFKAGIERFGDWAEAASLETDSGASVADFDRCLDTLVRISPAAMKTLIEAATATVLHDGEVSVDEAEMLRTVCVSLECPLPPILDAIPVPATP